MLVKLYCYRSEPFSLEEIIKMLRKSTQNKEKCVSVPFQCHSRTLSERPTQKIFFRGNLTLFDNLFAID